MSKPLKNVMIDKYVARKIKEGLLMEPDMSVLNALFTFKVETSANNLYNLMVKNREKFIQIPSRKTVEKVLEWFCSKGVVERRLNPREKRRRWLYSLNIPELQKHGIT